MSLDALEAARELLATKRIRSAISRAYYSAYSAVTARLARRKISFRHRFQNPAHEQLLPMLKQLSSLPIALRSKLAKALRRLRRGARTLIIGQAPHSARRTR